MPQVGKKHYPYTKAGEAQAAAERRKRRAAAGGRGNQGISGAMRGGGYGAPGRAPVRRGTPPPHIGRTTKSTTWESDR